MAELPLTSCPTRDAIFAAYEAELAEKRLSRDPR